MATTNQDGESLGRTLLRGAAWGVGFTVAVGVLRLGWKAITEDDDVPDGEELVREFEED